MARECRANSATTNWATTRVRPYRNSAVLAPLLVAPDTLPIGTISPCNVGRLRAGGQGARLSDCRTSSRTGISRDTSGAAHPLSRDDDRLSLHPKTGSHRRLAGCGGTCERHRIRCRPALQSMPGLPTEGTLREPDPWAPHKLYYPPLVWDDDKCKTTASFVDMI
jgi:hypothetical protein